MLPLCPSNHVLQPLRSVPHRRDELGPQPEKTESGKARVTWRKEAFRQLQSRLLEDEIRDQRTEIQGAGHGLLCAPVLRIHTGAPPPQTQKPAAKRSSWPSSCLGLSSWTCGLYSVSLDKIPPRPSVLLARTPGLVTVFCPGFSRTAGGREGVGAALPLRWEWKVGHSVGGS